MTHLHSNRTTMMYKIVALTAAGFTALMSLVPVAAAQSAGSDVKAILMVSPANGSFTVGDIVPIDVLLDTKGVSVSQVDFKLKYDPEYLQVQDSDSVRPGLQIKDGDLFEVLLSTSPVDANNGVIQYSKIALTDSKYYQTSTQPGKVATINFKAIKSGDTTIKFDTAKVGATEPTKVYRSSDELQVLDEVTNGDYEIKNSTGAAVSPTSTASPTQPTSTATSSATPAPTPAPTPTTPSANARPSLLMTLDQTSIKANGSDKAQVRVMLKNTDGLPMPNAKVNLTVEGSALISPASITTNEKGEGIATLTAGTQVGLITVNAVLDTNSAVTTKGQLNSVAAAAVAPTPPVKPSTAPTSTATVKPMPTVPAPTELQPVGPGSLVMSFGFSGVAALMILRRRGALRVSAK